MNEHSGVDEIASLFDTVTLCVACWGEGGAEALRKSCSVKLGAY